MEKQIEITGEQIGGNKPWVAKITGTDPKWGLKREFLKGLRDCSSANSVGTRGIETTWLIDEPGIYQSHLPQSWKKVKDEFFEITPGGVKQQIEKTDILKTFRKEN